MLAKLRTGLRRLRFRRLRRRFRDHTMVGRRRYVANLLLAHEHRDVPGAVVECGVWRGGMIAGLATVLGPERSYVLFDSFEGLPDAQPIDGEAAAAYQRDTSSPDYHDNCAAEASFARRAMALAGIEEPRLVQGWFADTLPGHSWSEPIALLRLDGDWYESTMTCLENLYDQVAPGGLIILDDYYYWEGCAKALHDFLSRTKSSARIRELDGVCYLLKPDAP